MNSGDSDQGSLSKFSQMLLFKLFIFALVLYVSEASRKYGRKKKIGNVPTQTPLSDLNPTTASMTATVSFPTSTTTATTTTSTSTTFSFQMPSTSSSADSSRGLEIAYDYAISLISEAAKKERAGNMNNMYTLCSSTSCPNLPLDQLVAKHSICIIDSNRLDRIFSYPIKFVKTILPHISSKPDSEKAVYFHAKLVDIMLSEFPACAFHPERFLSLDFVALAGLKVKDAIDYAEFLKLFMEHRDGIVSLPAVYMLNAFLQLDSMLHNLLFKKHDLEELELLFEARNDLLRIARKKAHYENVCKLMSSSFSRTVRTAMNDEKPSSEVNNITRVLESVDAIVSQGAVPEIRARIYAKGMSVFLLAEDAIHLCKDDDIYQEPYATLDFPLLLTDFLTFGQISSPLSRFISTIGSVLTCGNGKFIYHFVDYVPANMLVEAIKRLTYDQRFSASADLACRTYSTMALVMASFLPLIKEINTKKLSLKECLKRTAHQQPKCIYDSIVITFASLEFPQSSDEFQDLSKFLFKDYNKLKFFNKDVTEEVHEKVHDLIIKKMGGEFDEKILLNLINTELGTLNDFANNQTFVFPGKKARESVDDTKSENIFSEFLTKHNYIFREKHSYELLGMSYDPNGLSHLRITNLYVITLMRKVIYEMFSSFHSYHTIRPLAKTLSSLCNPVEQPRRDNASDIQEAPETALLRKADHIVQVLCTSPLLFTSSSLQHHVAHKINEVLHSEKEPYVKTTVAAFVWDYYATRGIDASCFLNSFQLCEGLSIYDLKYFPHVATNPQLEPLATTPTEMLIQSRGYCNFAFMSLMPIMRMVSSSTVPVKDVLASLNYLPAVLDIFMKDQKVAPHYHHAMITAISRAIAQYEPILTSSLLTTFWNQSRLIESLELLQYDTIRDISRNPVVFGPMALSALLSRHGKAFLFDDNMGRAYYGQFIVGFLEHDILNDAHFVQGYTNYFIAFIREAVALAPSVLKAETSNDRVFTRLQFLFNPSFEVKENELDMNGLGKCAAINRKVVHRMISEIFDTDNSQVYTILIQVLYRHYRYCKIWLSNNKSSLKDNGKMETKNHNSIEADSHLLHHISQLYSLQHIKNDSSQKYTVTASLAGPQNASNTSKSLKKPDTIIHQTTVTLPPKTSISSTTITGNNETSAKPKEDVHTTNRVKKPNLTNKNISKEKEENTEDSFDFLTPTPKKVIQKVTELKDDVASYFKSSTNGIRAPCPSLRLGTHELLLKYANAKGFPFLLDENFYNFLVGEEYKVDMSSFGNQLDAWIKAKQNVPLNNQMTRLELWVPNDTEPVTFSKNYFLRNELEAFLNENVHLRNRLVSLLQNSIQGKKSFDRITVLCKPLSQKLEIQSGTLSFDSSVSNAQTLRQLLSDFLTLKLQPIVENPVDEEVTLESGDNEILSETILTITETMENPNVSGNELNEESLTDNVFMAYEGQLQDIHSDIETQAKRIRVLRAQELNSKSSSDNDYKQRLQNMRPGNAEKLFVKRRLGELASLISDADYIAVDFELTGVSLNNEDDPNGFEDCKQSIKENSIVQVGLMLMKKSESDSFVQENSSQSIWKIPVCMNGNTDDSIWRKNSLDFLKSNGFDLLAWKVQSLEYSQLEGIWKALLGKSLITHNGLLDVLHLLRAAGRLSEITNVHSTDEFKEYLSKAGISVYDTRVLYNHTHPYFSLTQLSEAVLPRDKLKVGSAHDASYDAYCTGHLCRRFSAAVISNSRNALLETKRNTKKIQSDDTGASQTLSDAPVRPSAARRNPKPLNQTSNNSSSSAAPDSRTYQAFVPALQSPRQILNDAPTRPDAARRIPKPSQNQKSSSNSSSLAALNSQTFQEFIPDPHYHQQSTAYYAPPLQQQQTYFYRQSLISPRTITHKSQIGPQQPLLWPSYYQQNSFPMNSTAENSNEKDN